MIQLSPHFSLEELLASETATSRNIEEQFNPTPEIIANLTELCNGLLEPLRASISAHLGKDTPIHITSGYRCPALNAAIGGVPNSQHQFGQAADTHIDGMSIEDWYMFIKTSTLPYDQLLQEFNEWAHVSHVASGNRGERWRYVKGQSPIRD